MTLRERLWARIRVRFRSLGPQAVGLCWLWDKPHAAAGGYGYLRWAGKLQPVHRLMWELLWGTPVPQGTFLRNQCKAKHCTNPAHWSLASSPAGALRANGERHPWSR